MDNAIAAKIQKRIEYCKESTSGCQVHFTSFYGYWFLSFLPLFSIPSADMLGILTWTHSPVVHIINRRIITLRLPCKLQPETNYSLFGLSSRICITVENLLEKNTYIYAFTILAHCVRIVAHLRDDLDTTTVLPPLTG